MTRFYEVYLLRISSISFEDNIHNTGAHRVNPTFSLSDKKYDKVASFDIVT